MTTANPVPPLGDSDDTPPPPRGVRKNLLALGSAAVLAVYTAGFVRTRAAALQFENAESRRRIPVPELVVPLQDTVPAPAPVLQPTSVAKAAPARVDSGVAVVAAPAAPSLPADTAKPDTAVTTKPDAAAAATDSIRQGLKDGRYRGWGYSQHGNIEAEIEIQGGRIVNASYVTCLMAWSCDQYIRHLPAQVVERQSPDVDTVTRVTQSSDAFYWAVVNALKQAT